jgi:hypothetical protein
MKPVSGNKSYDSAGRIFLQLLMDAGFRNATDHAKGAFAPPPAIELVGQTDDSAAMGDDMPE